MEVERVDNGVMMVWHGVHCGWGQAYFADEDVYATSLEGSMKAGRELDALIAEKVMGWKPRQSKHGYWNLDGPNGEHFTDIDRRDYTAQYDKETGQKVQQAPWWEYFWDEIPFYSTDIAAAWEVVEKADLWSLYGSIGDGPYRACIQFEDREGLMTADTAPLAICLAALKAKGVTGEQHG
ncbi:MAG: hypothetical protein GDA68_18745 [Nitrospira sp. CR2.1]|nr:hypothetical protein [Nitrospira sp. CR2.1]MBA5875225.1 hypothetical protein [Nitrospira sp. CR1.2]